MNDPKPESRVRDPALLIELHFEWKRCLICRGTEASEGRLSLHHVFDRSDVRENLVMLCGDGVLGCHGAVTRNDWKKLVELGAAIQADRGDIIAYVVRKLGEDRARAWFLRRLALSF